MEYKTFVLKDNSEEIRKTIEDAGIRVCICASFENACWLDYHTSIANGVHGVGYYGGETDTNSQEEVLARFVSECKDMVVCKDVDEFIANIKEYENGKTK